MSLLRDIRLPEHFKHATNLAFRAIKNTDDLTLQNFQHIIAQAMGARSLEAFLAEPAPKTTLPASALPVAHDWVVFLVTPHYSRHARAWHADGKLAEGWHNAINDQCLIALPAARAESAIKTIMASPGFGDGGSCKAVPLSKWRPSLFVLLQCDVQGVRDALNESSEYAQELHDFHLSRDDWQSEVDDGNVLSGYADWVVSQLEQWRDHCARH